MRITIGNRIILCALLAGVRLSAQEETRADQIEAARAQKETALTPPEDPTLEEVIIHGEGSLPYRLITAQEGFGVGFGQLIPGAGFSAGPRYRKTLWDGHLRLGGSLYGSAKEFYMARFDATVLGLLDGRGLLNLSSSHSDFPQMPFYGEGPDSRKTGRSDYRLENTNVEIRPTFRLAKNLTAGALGSFMAINVGPGTASQYISTDKISMGPRPLPGFSSRRVT